MKILQLTTAALGLLFILGTAPDGKAVPIQPITITTQQENIILAHREGRGRGHGDHDHWHKKHHHGHGGIYYGPVYRPSCIKHGIYYQVCPRPYYRQCY